MSRRKRRQASQRNSHEFEEKLDELEMSPQQKEEAPSMSIDEHTESFLPGTSFKVFFQGEDLKLQAFRGRDIFRINGQDSQPFFSSIGRIVVRKMCEFTERGRDVRITCAEARTMHWTPGGSGAPRLPVDVTMPVAMQAYEIEFFGSQPRVDLGKCNGNGFELAIGKRMELNHGIREVMKTVRQMEERGLIPSASFLARPGAEDIMRIIITLP